MKKLLLIFLSLLYLATTFQSDNPPGWYQQALPVNDFVNDIFFLDSLNGWVVTKGNYNSNDTSYILHTTNGGINWIFQNKGRENLNTIQFVNLSDGYALGDQNGTINMSIYKTTNGGNNWITLNNLKGVKSNDLFFVNPDTGWIGSNDLFDGGVFKTIDGGNSWLRQASGEYTNLFFINADTGWIGFNGTDKRIYRTNNGGTNWELQFTFPQHINDIFFVNNMDGFVSSGRMYKTTNGGSNWVQSTSDVGGIQLSFVTDSIGWAGVNFNIISKTLDGGNSWFYQSSPTFNNSSVNGIDSLHAWAAGSGIVHTTDGGGLSGLNFNPDIIPQSFKLNQNYPNPFNPNTIIKYTLEITGNVLIKVFDVEGKLIQELVNKKQSPAEYQINFNGSNLPSGVYFCRMEIMGEKSGDIYTDSKKMILIR